MKSYNQLTQQYLASAGLERIRVKDVFGELRLMQVPKARAERLIRSGKAIRG